MRFRTPIVIVSLGITALLAVGCSSSSSSEDSATPPASAPAVSTEIQGSRPPFDPSQFQAVQACLSAAGLDGDLPSPPSGATPGGTASPPAGGPDIAGFQNLLRDPSVQEALAACGITIPTTLPTLAPSGTP